MIFKIVWSMREAFAIADYVRLEVALGEISPHLDRSAGAITGHGRTTGHAFVPTDAVDR
jgi:hypothetical protein